MSYPAKNPRIRFARKYVPEPNSGCWTWLGFVNRRGYGRFFNGNTLVQAHRFSYEQYHGSIPEGCELDHLCRNTGCVNPAHLEAVSHRINILRGTSPAAQRARKHHCDHGHSFTPENTYTDSKNRRSCRQCHLLTEQKRRQRQRSENVTL